LGYSEAELAAIRKLKRRTLANERAAGRGPPYIKDGKTIWYPRDKFKRYMESKMVTPGRERTLATGKQRRRRA
jgi:hypothetical protein